MNASIDLGNTRAKVGIFDQHQLKEMLTLESVDDVLRSIKNFSGGSLIISSVNTEANQILAAVRNFKNTLILTASTPVPFENKYATPTTLGVDRIAAICGAHEIHPGKNCLVIDAGTCITYDILTGSGAYLGGGISPGLSMRFKAMNTFTARLPLVERNDDPELIGNSTETCMQSGAILGAIEEMDGIIRRYSDKFEGLQVILTGGDCRFFESKLKASIFAVPELVLRGLNSILLHNIRD